MKNMADQRKREQSQRAERENRGDGERGIFVIGFNGALGGDDGAHAADRRTNGKKRCEFGLELEQSAKKGHEREGAGDFNGHENEADAAELQYVTEQKPGAEQHDPRLQPEFIRGDACTEHFRNADGVGDQEAEDDSPQDVLDIRKRPMMRLGVSADVLLQKFARVADGGKQENSRNDAQKSQRRLHRPNLRNRDYISHVLLSPFS